MEAYVLIEPKGGIVPTFIDITMKDVKRKAVIGFDGKDWKSMQRFGWRVRKVSIRLIDKK